jgi:hypothetical protein
MHRFVHVSSVLSAAASAVLLTLGIAATVNSAFADETLPVTASPCTKPSCGCPSPPGDCETDHNNCSACLCNGATCF